MSEEVVVITAQEMKSWLDHYDKVIAPTRPGPEYLLCACNGTWIATQPHSKERFILRSRIHSYDHCYKQRKRKAPQAPKPPPEGRET